MRKISINFAHHQASDDRTLEAILGKINNTTEGKLKEPAEIQAASEYIAKEIARTLTNVQARREDNISLDLIGHTYKGVLLIGKWKIDINDNNEYPTKEIFKRVTANNSTLNICNIRLLGCISGATAEGVEALTALQDIAKNAKPAIRVYGTTEPLHAEDFYSAGLAHERLLSPAETAQPTDLVELLKRWWARRSLHFRGRQPSKNFRNINIGGINSPLQVESVASLRASLRLYGDKMIPITVPSIGLPPLRDLVEGSPKHIRGLLELPKGELAIPIKETNLYHKLTVLFEGHFLRIYPVGERDGLLFKVKEKNMPILLEALRPGNNLPPLR